MDSGAPPSTGPDRRQVLAALATGTGLVAGCVGGSTSDDGNNTSGTAGNESGNETVDASSDATSEETAVPVLGDPDAPVTLEIYEDFLCSGCARYNTEFAARIRENYTEPETIRYEHRDAPRIRDPDSWEAANAARAVFEEHGNEAFWEYGKRLFEDQRTIVLDAPDIYGTIAEELGFDGETVQSAAVDRSYADRIERDIERSEAVGVTGVPGFVINGEFLEPDLEEDPRFEDFIETIMEELDAAIAEAN
jgi:protein-disulfide isomerase